MSAIFQLMSPFPDFMLCTPTFNGNLFMMMSQHSNLKAPQAQVGKYLPKFHL